MGVSSAICMLVSRVLVVRTRVVITVNKTLNRGTIYGLKVLSIIGVLFKALILTLKEPGFLDPSHSRGGGADSTPKISETD